MLVKIAHRGPDGDGVHVAGRIGLGHVRLAILDLSDAATQPMVSHDGRYVITYNGEVFNFRALRRKLEERGVVIHSTGDTEVLLELLANFGAEEILPMIEGFFAFALWDRRERSLLMARDRHGIKPLYYHCDDQRLTFASEMRPLIGPSTPPQQQHVAATLLGWGGTEGPGTLFEGIRSLGPGTWIRFQEDGRHTSGSFFQITDFFDRDLFRELASQTDAQVMARVDAAFEESIDYRLVSDAPVACLASGGIDSSLVAAAAAKRAQKQLVLFHADIAHNSERPWAEQLARELGLPILSVRVDDEMFLDNVAVTTLHAEVPLIYHANSVPFYLLSRLVSQHGFKVVLTGEGSDEYFLGYPMLAIGRYLQAIRSVTSSAQRLLHRAFPRGAGLLWPQRQDSPGEQLRRLLFNFREHAADEDVDSDISHITGRRDRELARATVHLLRGHLTTLLHRNDRLGMASGIESRFPFLGLSLARLAVNLPAKFKIRRVPRFYNVRHPFHMDKWAVRQMAARRLPANLVRRPKKGFPISIASRAWVDPAFFVDGTVAQWFELRRQDIAKLPQKLTRPFVFSLLLLETWGAVLSRNEPVDLVRERIRRHVRLDA